MSHIPLLRLRLHLAQLSRAVHPDPPHGADGKFYSAGVASGNHHDPVAHDESFHPRTATGEHVGGKGFQLYRESEHLRESLAKLHVAAQEKPELKSLATWRGQQGYHAIADHRAGLEAQLRAEGAPSPLEVRELQALYAIYQRRLGATGYISPAYVGKIVSYQSASAKRLQRESVRIASYLKRYGHRASVSPAQRGHLISGAANKDLTAAVDAGLAREKQQAQRVTTAEMVRARLAALRVA
jgi:hypothetical protein